MPPSIKSAMVVALELSDETEPASVLARIRAGEYEPGEPVRVLLDSDVVLGRLVWVEASGPDEPSRDPRRIWLQLKLAVDALLSGYSGGRPAGAAMGDALRVLEPLVAALGPQQPAPAETQGG